MVGMIWMEAVFMTIRRHISSEAVSEPERTRILRTAGIEVHETGTKHGTITAVVEGKPVEVTTYRVEGSYRPEADRARQAQRQVHRIGGARQHRRIHLRAPAEKNRPENRQHI